MVSARRIFPLLVVTLAACSQPSEVSLAEPPDLFAPGTSSVVAPSVLTHATCGQLTIPDRGDWTPNSEQIIDLEEILLERLKVELARDAEEYGGTQSTPSEYLRGYSGMTGSDGQALIAVCGQLRRFYEEGSPWSWPENSIALRDGGSNTFGAIYDPESRQITYFGFGYNA